ncbi:MAG TPA: hypothetical protein VFV98_11830 [Vicinamibacterales bacterium]|nr:hypothetical protein [Vicinamibacterales bacterium]
MPLLLPFLIAFALTLALVPVVSRVARARGLVAHPSTDRWHRQPIPNVGGAAMLVPFMLALVFSGVVTELAPVVAGCSLMFIIGLGDDLHPVRPATKFVLQMLAASVMLVLLPPFSITGAPTLDLMLGFAWIVGITNAVNLLDNIDGLAAGVAGIAGAFLLLVLFVDHQQQTPLAFAVAGFVGATTAFLIYNFSPASIFMGDGGSHLLGSFLAAASLMAAPKLNPHLAPVAAIPVVLMLIPIFDTAFVTLSRNLAGRSPFLGGRDHTSHRLVALGIGERRAVLVLYALAAAAGGVALGLRLLPPGLAWGLVGVCVTVLGALGIYLGHVQVTRPDSAEPPLPIELTVNKRVYEVVLDAILIAGAYYMAFAARFNQPQFAEFMPYFTRSLPLVVGLQVAALWFTGKYRQVWAGLGLSEILGLLRGSLLGVAASVIAIVYTTGLQGHSRLVFAFDALLAPVLLVSARVALNTVDQYLRIRRTRGHSALIYGAGRGGLLATRELQQNPTHGLSPLGFIDDDARKRRQRIDGLPVLGSLEDLAALLDRRAGTIGAVVVAIGDLPRQRLEQVYDVCAARNIPVRRMRFTLDEVRPSKHPQEIVRFPGA